MTRIRATTKPKKPDDTRQPAKESTAVPVSKGALDTFARICGSADSAFNLVLLRETLPTVWVPGTEHDGQDQRARAVMTALRAFKPTNEIEGLLAAQTVALHFGAMECLRRAMLPEQPFDIATRLRRDGANLSRAMTEMLDALERKRGKGPQVVRVERVVVQEGGQAIVGNVSPGTSSTPQRVVEAPTLVPPLGLSAASAPSAVAPGGPGEG